VVNNIMVRAYAWAQGIRTSMIESLKQESGQDVIEYAVLAGAIGIAAALAFLAGPDIPGIIGDFVTKVGGCIQLSNATCT